MLKRINDLEVKVREKHVGGGDKVLGYELRKDPYAIIFLAARKKSGKTTTIREILEQCLPKKIPVIIFCPTLDSDISWREIIKWLKKRGNEVFEYYNIIDPETRENNLLECMRHMESLDREDPKHISKKGLKYMLIMDDCGKQMRHPSVYQFLLKNRHEKCGVILSGQSMKNLMPDSRQQVGLWLLFPKLNDKDLQMIYEDSDPPISWEEFKALYDKATNEPYSFLYFTPDGEFRRKFTHKFEPQRGGFIVTADESKEETRDRMNEELRKQRKLDNVVANYNKPAPPGLIVRALRALGLERAADAYHKWEQSGTGKEPLHVILDDYKAMRSKRSL